MSTDIQDLTDREVLHLVVDRAPEPVFIKTPGTGRTYRIQLMGLSKIDVQFWNGEVWAEYGSALPLLGPATGWRWILCDEPQPQPKNPRTLFGYPERGDW